ncbi:MAG: malto-oligosyltrehalose trehalohydrolase [Bacteroidota bacterium]|nr:malto-oligosyltrehalose trehalohydrolase [Bacteroidota bacterium]
MNSLVKKIGSWYDKGIGEFRVWAPLRERVELVLESPAPVVHPMQKDEWGYWSAAINAPAGSTYVFRLDGETCCPDPASISQPKGVHGPSELIERDGFAWSDESWQGLPLSNMIIYELHVGAFSPTHDFDGIICKLDYLAELGINTIELMPIAQFPGERNWGYDGVYPFAVHPGYGGRTDLKRLVNAIHAKGMALILDVVYNHLGPEGNYLREFGPYFTAKYRTPWGDAINLDDAWSDGVRNFFLQNAQMWFEEFHIDGLRLDAVHAIRDFSAHPFIRQLKELALQVGEGSGHPRVLIAELDLNDIRYIAPPEKGGYGLDGQWCDEFHHALHALLTGERHGYYEDFGEIDHLVAAFRDTFVYHGNYSPHRKRGFGAPVGNTPYGRFIVFSQNHDQIGNRAMGDRSSERLSFEQLKLAAATVLLSPYIPLLFMGEEYGEINPFLFFTGFEDPELIESIRNGRKKEFRYADGDGLPDPQAEDTFLRSNLSWRDREEPGATLFNYYRFLIDFRARRPAMQAMERDSMRVHHPGGQAVCIDRRLPGDHLLIWLNFNGHETIVGNDRESALRPIFDSASAEWRGPGGSGLCEIPSGSKMVLSAFSAAVFEMIP